MLDFGTRERFFDKYKDPATCPVQPVSSIDLVVGKVEFGVFGGFFEPGFSAKEDVYVMVGRDL